MWCTPFHVKLSMTIVMLDVGLLVVAGALLLLLAPPVALYTLFGPGIDSDHPRALLPVTDEDEQFLKQHVANGQEQSGFLSRPRYSGSQSVKLFYRIWLPKPADAGVQPPKGVVVTLTGINGHSARKNRGMVEVLQAGFVLAGYDHEGMGRSGGRHGYFASALDLADDAIAFVTMIREQFPVQRVFLHGGSLGGLIILLVLARIQPGLVDGAVILSPAVQIHKKSRPPAAVELVGRVLRALAPKLPVLRGSQGRGSSPEVAEAIEALRLEDPLFYNGRMRIGTGLAILEGIEYLQSRVASIETPYLLQHGTSDLVCHVSGSEELHAQTSSKDKTLKIYDGGAHDLGNEPPRIRDAVVQDYVAWLTERALRP